MYFEIEPKSKDKDFYGYSHEFSEVERALKRKERIIVLRGVRRVGKTSLMNIFFNKYNKNSLWIDGRMIKNPIREIPFLLNERVKTKQNIIGQIEGVGVSAFGMGVNINVKKSDFYYIDNFSKNKEHFYIFIDEAQRSNSKELADFISYVYDKVKNISFILSGSEIGLLEEVVGTYDATHSLYGRQILYIDMNRLDRSGSEDFLKKGFEQLNMKIDSKELTSVVNELDGLIGWLTLYGYNRCIVNKKNPLIETVNVAHRIAEVELQNFLNTRKNKKLYSYLLRYIDGKSWTELDVILSSKIGKVNPNSLSSALSVLEDYSFIYKKDGLYYISDPLYLKASSSLII